jgi:myotubularin-related protein 6/7/8
VAVNESSVDSSFVIPGDAETVSGGRTATGNLSDSAETDPDAPRIYGAQQRNLIVDARPTVNAMVMQAVGQGSEKMEYYPNAEKAYLGIDNIHVMRKSLAAVVDALKDSDIMNYPPNRRALANSGWIKHIDNILRGTELIARTVGIMHSHVLIHCSDGWDRTSQLSALSQICLDPYYRTIEGFVVLVEKDWLSPSFRILR